MEGKAGKAHHARMIKILLGPSTRPGARQETRLRPVWECGFVILDCCFILVVEGHSVTAVPVDAPLPDYSDLRQVACTRVQL